jgi:hypothetical protein
MDYYSKYVKYKTKYLQMRLQGQKVSLPPSTKGDLRAISSENNPGLFNRGNNNYYKDAEIDVGDGPQIIRVRKCPLTVTDVTGEKVEGYVINEEEESEGKGILVVDVDYANHPYRNC